MYLHLPGSAAAGMIPPVFRGRNAVSARTGRDRRVVLLGAGVGALSNNRARQAGKASIRITFADKGNRFAHKNIFFCPYGTCCCSVRRPLGAISSDN
jgi:hypothetical protein